MTYSTGIEQEKARPFRQVWDRVGIYVLVLIVPLILLGVALWQIGRVNESSLIYGSAAEAMPAVLEELRGIEATDRTAMIATPGDSSRTIFVGQAISEVEQSLPIARRGTMLNQVRKPVAVAAAVGAGIALLAGAVGLIAAAQAGRAARRSRDQLIASFSRIHRILPFVLGGLVLGLAISTLGIAVFETIGLYFWERASGNAIKLILAGLLLAGFAVYGAVVAVLGLREIFTLGAIEPMDVRGLRVDEADAPALWRFVGDIAGRQGASAPDAIVAGIDQGFYVTEHPMKLHPTGETLAGRTLYLPAPYLEMLDENELAGVIGHELAHFVGEDTAYSRHFSPIYMGLDRAIGAMGVATSRGFALSPAFRLGVHMMEQFDHAVKHWGRLREFEADRMSGAVVGPRAIASALLRISVISPVVDDTLDRAFQAPAEGERDLVADMVGAVRERGWPDMTEHLEDRAAHPTDTHPSTPQRIQALNVPLDDGLIAGSTRPLAEAAATPGSTLFADWLETRRRLSDDFNSEARVAHDVHRAGLEDAVSRIAAEDVHLYERSLPMVAMMGGLGSIVAIIALGVLFLALTSVSESQALIVAGLICAAIAAGMLGFAWLLHRRGRTPMITLTPDAFHTDRLTTPLRWLESEGFGVSAGNKVELNWVVAPTAVMPEKARRSPRTRIRTKKRLVTMQCYGIRGMKPQAFSDLIGQYMDAAHARQELAKR